MAQLQSHFKVRCCSGQPCQHIDGVKFRDHINFDPDQPFLSAGTPPTGRWLEKQRGFSMMLERPRPSFKVYRALAEAGMKEIADIAVTKNLRSTVTPRAVWNQACQFLLPTAHRYDSPAYQRALARLRADFRIDEKLSLQPLKEVAKTVPQNTSPGIPFIFTHPGKKKGEVLAERLPALENYWERVGRLQPVHALPDCAAFARSHISDPEKNKVRAVWAYPLYALIEEGRYALPIINALKEGRIGDRTAYGLEMLKGGMKWIDDQVDYLRRKRPGTKFFMTDYSSFDSTVPAWLIRDCFSIVQEKLDMGEAGTPEYDSNRRRFRKIVDYFVNTPIRNADGRRFQKDHGVPSGSYFTNLIDTMVNLLVTDTLVDEVFGVEPELIVTFGDDGIIFLPPAARVDVDAYAERAQQCFGMKINNKKSYWTLNPQNIHFLGYYNNKGAPFKPTRELIASLMWPQYLKEDWSYAVARSIGTLFAAAGQNSTIFHAVNAVCQKAASRGEDLQEAVDVINNNARMKRFLENLGMLQSQIGLDVLTWQGLTSPLENCSKLRLGKGLEEIKTFLATNTNRWIAPIMEL